MIEDILKVFSYVPSYDYKEVITLFLYGQCEQDFKKAKDLAIAKNPSGPLAAWSIVILRYFNPVGAHPSGLIG